MTTLKDDDKIVQTAMEIIVTAGDARVDAGKALDAISADDFALAKSCLNEAKTNITKAHNAQTEIIQSEIAGATSYEPSLLFNHAQDTLMTIMSEIHMTEKLITMFEVLNTKMEKVGLNDK